MFILFSILVVLPATTMSQAIDIHALTHDAFGLFYDLDENNDMVLVLQEIDDWFYGILGYLFYSNVTYDIFKSYIRRHLPDIFHYVRALYDAFDLNHDTLITFYDLENAFELADKNNDGKIFQSEFIGYFTDIFMGWELLAEIEDFLSTTPSM